MPRSIPLTAVRVGTDEAGILPTQLLAPQEADAQYGERELLMAVVELALTDIRRYWTARGSAGELAVEAFDWIMSNDAPRGRIGFVWACEHLGLDAGRIRRRVIAWTTDMNAGMALRPMPLRRVAGQRHSVTGRTTRGKGLIRWRA